MKRPTPEQLREYRLTVENIHKDTDEDTFEWLNKFDEEYDLSTYTFEEEGRVGLKDAAGEVLIPAIYDALEYTISDGLRDRLVPAALNGKAALIIPDGKGTPFTKFEFDNISVVTNLANPIMEYYCLQIGDKFGLTDTEGSFLIPMGADVILEPDFNIISYKKNDKYGFASLSTKVVTEAIYEGYDNRGNYLEVIKDGERGWIDNNGNFTTDPEEKSFDYTIYNSIISF